MNLRIEIPPGTFERLQLQAADAGVGVEAFVLATLSERLDETAPSHGSGVRGKRRTAEEFSNWLREWANKFPRLEQPIDDSRESIYAGRGE